MSSIRLYPQLTGDSGPFADGTPAIGNRRVGMWVRLGGEYLARPAILDTGSPACILTRKVWHPLHQRELIEWVSPPNSPTSTPRRVTMLGRQFPYRIGRMDVQFVDLELRELPSKPVTVICTEDEDCVQHLILIGLSELLHGCTVTLSATAEGEWNGTITEPN